MGRLIKYTFIFYTYETKGVIFSGVKNIVIELNDPKERINTDTDETYRRKLKILPSIHEVFWNMEFVLLLKLKPHAFKEDKDNINDTPTK